MTQVVAPRWNSFFKNKIGKTKPKGKEKEPKQKPTAPKELGQRQMPSKDVDKKRSTKRPRKMAEKNAAKNMSKKQSTKVVDIEEFHF